MHTSRIVTKEEMISRYARRLIGKFLQQEFYSIYNQITLMKPRQLLIPVITLCMTAVSSHAATIAWNFTGNVRTASTNDFGSGITTSNYTISGLGLDPGGMINSERAATRFKNGSDTHTFSIIIPNGVSVNLTNLSFDFGHSISQGNGSANTAHNWSLSSITNGGASVTTSGNGPTMAAGTRSTNFNLALTGLTGETNTTITFTLLDNTLAENNNTNRTFFDNVTITGTVVPEPSTALLGALGLLALLRRRRN